MSVNRARPRSLAVHVASWNVGNEAPQPVLHPWIPAGGGGADIVVACGQVRLGR